MVRNLDPARFIVLALPPFLFLPTMWEMYVVVITFSPPLVLHMCLIWVAWSKS